jgi:hypothetical protein
MPKKSQRQQVTEAQLIAWYKWEFLRRNSEYRRDFERFIRKWGSWFDKHGYWYDQTVEPWGRNNLQFFANKIAPDAKSICLRWAIRDPYSPDWEFTKSGAYYYKPGWEVFLPTDCFNESAGELWDLSDLFMSRRKLLKSMPYPKWPRPDYQLGCAFDLRRPLSLLVREAATLITDRKDRYDRKHPVLSELTGNNRRRLDLYDRYLRIWDSRSQGGKFEAIGAAEFGDQPRRAQNARDSFRAAQQLIDGGYKELR